MDTVSNILDWTVFSVGDATTSLRTLLTAIAVLILTHFLSKTVRNTSARIANRLDKDKDSNNVVGISVLFVVWIVGIEVAFNLLGFNLTTLFAASGFLALGAGFALKNIVENFLSGVILRIERTIGPSDVLIVNDRYIVVKKIAFSFGFKAGSVSLTGPTRNGCAVCWKMR